MPMNPVMNPLVMLFLVLAVLLGLTVLACVARKLNPSALNGTIASPNYEALPALLTPAERSFFGVLHQVVPPNVCLFAKVRLADVIQPRSSLDLSMRQSAFNKISSKHIDFVLCDADTTRVVCVVELDDSSHHRGSRQARDSFVDGALQFASIPVIRFSARHRYAPENIRIELAKAGVLVLDAQRRMTGVAQSNVAEYRPQVQPAG